MDRLHSVYPFIRWWTCGWFASLGYCEQCCTKDSHASFVWTPVSVLLGLCLGGELLGHMLTLFNFWGTATHFLLVHQRPCKALKHSVSGSNSPEASLLAQNKSPDSTSGPGQFLLAPTKFSTVASSWVPSPSLPCGYTGLSAPWTSSFSLPQGPCPCCSLFSGAFSDRCLGHSFLRSLPGGFFVLSWVVFLDYPV